MGKVVGVKDKFGLYQEYHSWLPVSSSCLHTVRQDRRGLLVGLMPLRHEPRLLNKISTGMVLREETGL